MIEQPRAIIEPDERGKGVRLGVARTALFALGWAMSHRLLFVLGIFCAGAALAEPAPPRVTLQTALGAIVVEVDPQHAPVTTANFLRYVDQKRLDGTNFYRALNIAGAPGVGLIQGGTGSDPKRSLKPIAHEPTSLTGLSHTDGAISMARGAPGSAAGDFFIIVGTLTGLDASPADPGYAVFGHVVDGMDTVRQILAAPVSATAGQGVMKGQMLAAQVKIVSARRVP